MKLKELIEKYEEYENGLFDFGAKIACQIFLKDLQQLDEPRPVKVKQFVADWITHSKNIGRSLFGAMSIFEENFEIKKWMQWAENQETFALAWIFGYEVEKEKRYIVKIKNLDSDVRVLKKRNRWYFGGDWGDSRDTELKIHTRKQLEEADFGWVFDCPGIEIEEVEG